MATSKLTLSVDKDTILRAKTIASEDNISVSKLFKTLINERDKKKKKEVKMKPLKEYPQWIQDLTLSDKPTPDFDHKAEYGKHIEEKYGL